MAAYPQSVAYTRAFKMIDSADHFSKKTGLTCTVNISKAGAAFGAAAGTVTEVASGWYKVALTTADTGTLGDLAFYITASGADDTDFVDQVIDAVRGLGAPTALPNAAAGANGGLPLGDASGRVDIGKLLGTAWLTPGTAGTPDVNVKLWNALTTVELPLVPTTAGRKLDVSAGGEAGLDWANVGSPTTTLALTGTTIATTQKVDIETIKTNPVVNAGTLTFPTTATLASTTNITAGTITTVTAVTTVNGLAANVITAASIAADAITAAKIADGAIDAATFAAGAINAAAIGADAITAAKIADGAIDAATFAAGAINAAAIAADAITDAKVAADVTIASVTGAVGSVTGAVGSVTGSVGSVVGAVGSVTGAVGSVAGNVGGNVTGSVGSVVGNVGGNVVGSTGSVTGTVGGIAGTTQTLDALQTALNSAHGAGSWATATGFSTLDAAGVRTAVGLAVANLDIQLAALDVDILTRLPTASYTAPLTAAGTRTALGLASANLDTQFASIFTTAMTESYAADGVAPTPAQALFAIQQNIIEFSIVGTTITVKKLDGSTTAMTMTLDSATDPTSRTRAT